MRISLRNVACGHMRTNTEAQPRFRHPKPQAVDAHLRLHAGPKTSRSRDARLGGQKRVTRLSVGWPEGLRPAGESSRAVRVRRGGPWRYVGGDSGAPEVCAGRKNANVLDRGAQEESQRAPQRYPRFRWARRPFLSDPQRQPGNISTLLRGAYCRGDIDGRRFEVRNRSAASLSRNVTKDRRTPDGSATS